MSTREQLRLDTYRLLNEDDSDDATNSTPSNTHFDSTEIDDYIQKGITLLGTEIEWPFQISSATTVEDQALYQLPSDFIELTDVYLDGRPLTVLERGDLKTINSLWQQADSGSPNFAYKADNDVIGLYPAPDSDNTDLDLQVEYIQIPADLASDADVPNLHAALHLCLPFYAAYRAHLKLGNEKSAAGRFADYEIHKKKLLAKVQNWSPDLMRFTFPADM